MEKKRNPKPKLPASLAQYKPGKGILRHIRCWLAEMPEDITAYSMTEERRLELRFSLAVSIAFSAYSMPAECRTRHSGLPMLTPAARAELTCLYRAMQFGPHGDSPRQSYCPRNENEGTYWSLLQSDARVARFATRAGKAERKVANTALDAKRGKRILSAASQGGREAARQHYEPKREEYRSALVEYVRVNPNVSLTAARQRIANRFEISRRTVERHTKDLFIK